MKLSNVLVLGAAAAMMGTSAMAQSCGPDGASIRILASDFPAIHAVVDEAEANCGAGAGEIVRNHTTEARQIMNAALTPNPSEYSSVIVANSTLVQLMNDGLVRPLNDYVEAYGENIEPHQLITIDGNVMAIAFMANSQHMYARTDVLAEVGIDEVPSTFEEMLTAAEAIREAGIMEHPIVMNMQVGWNLGEAFNLFFLAHGGSHFEPGTALPNVNSPEGVAALEMMARVVEYTNPDFLTQASNETQAVWEAGQAAMGIMWGSRGAVILDDEGASEEVTSNTVLAAAPSVEEGGTPAATLWWDGFTIAANVPDEEAEATFAMLASGLTSDMVMGNNDDAVWLLDGFEPGPAAAGVAATAGAGAMPYPMAPQMGLMHTVIDGELSGFLQGNESAEQALTDIEEAYEAQAREAGFLQ